MATVLPLVALPPPPRPSADLRVLAAAAGALGFATGLLCVTFLPFGSWSVPSSAAWATMPLALSPATMGGRLSQHIPRSTGTYPPPPLSFPTPCRSPGGGGGPSLRQPKIFRCGSLCCCWVTVLWGTTTCIPCTHGRTFCSLSLKWNLIAQPCFPLGQV